MSKMNPEDLISALRWRYATKRFDPARKITESLWKTLEQALVLAPSSFGLQPFKFVVVTDPGLKTKLRAVSWNQPQIEECSHLVVFAARKGIDASDVERYIGRIVEVRGVPQESLSGFKDMMLGALSGRPREALDAWTARQAYIALGVLLTSAAALGVDACPMEGLDGSKYDEILGLTGYGTLCVAALGYRSSEDAYGQLPKVRFPAEQLVDVR